MPRLAPSTVLGIVLTLAVAVSGSANAAPSADAYPVTVTVTSGPVTIDKQPRRIVSLSPTATETLFAIGAGGQVVAVDDQSDYPKTAPKTTLSGFTPNVEAIAAYNPDLVVIAYDPKGFTDALSKLGIQVLHMDAAKVLRGAYQQIRQLGRVTGHDAEAASLVKRMRLRIDTIVAKAKAKSTGLSVYHELSPDLYTATSSTFIGRVYSLFGLKNISDAADSTGFGYPQLSAEYVVSSSPDLIVLADTVCCGQTPQTVGARPGWDRISAVRTGSIVRIDDSIASRWGPRLVNLVRAVATAIARLES